MRTAGPGSACAPPRLHTRRQATGGSASRAGSRTPRGSNGRGTTPGIEPGAWGCRVRRMGCRAAARLCAAEDERHVPQYHHPLAGPLSWFAASHLHGIVSRHVNE
eukprot:scaffold22752_cov52-Phaeocystis_antarctica.AAC.3